MSGIRQLLQDIRTQANGFQLGVPQNHPGGVLVPVLRATTKGRTYLTLREAPDGALRISDTGDIDAVRVSLDRSVSHPVFARQGSIFEGRATQSRALQAGVLLFPGERTEVPVRCIHASHGIRSSASFSYAGLAPGEVQLALAEGDQSDVWGSVSQCAESALVPSDDLVAVVRGRQRTHQVALLPGQVGAVFMGRDGSVAFELFGHPGAWAAQQGEILESWGVPEHAGPECRDLPTADAVLARLEGAGLGKALFENRRGLTCVLRVAGFTGEVTLLDRGPIHLQARSLG